MKIQLEFKDKKYTLTFGKFKASAPSIEEAIDILVNGFRADLEKFFVIKKP